MSDEALLREAARCRRLAREATDLKLAAMLEAIAYEYEARTFSPATPEPISTEVVATAGQVA
jgi:hypothetical protein